MCCHGNQGESSVELQYHHAQLVTSLGELLALGRDRLDAGPEEELRDRARLTQQHAGHMVSRAERVKTVTRLHIKALKSP